MTNNMNYTPIIIIGAPRSGTNILRDCLSSFPCIASWNCDEINPIWKYGNYDKFDDLKISDLRPEIDNYIKNEFLKIAESCCVNKVLEKTCANSLRPGFVHKIFPNAKFILIFRDGGEVIPSIIKRSKGEFTGNKFVYRIKKLRYAPASYLWALFKSRIGFAVVKRQWGPASPKAKFDGDNLEEKAFHQWKLCISTTIDYFQEVDSNSYCAIDYKALTANPIDTLQAVSNFLGLDLINEDITAVAKQVHKKNRNKHWQFSDLNLQPKVTILNEKIKEFIGKL